MPTLNQGEYIEEAIRSVLDQDYSEKELIIIDGGSTDGTVDIIRRYERHLKFWISEKDNGQSEAINKGLPHTSGSIIAWLNSDDIYEKGAFLQVAHLFQTESLAEIVSGRAVLFGKGKRPQTIGLMEPLAPARYLSYMRFPQPSCFFRRTVFESCGHLQVALHYAMDFELVVRAVMNSSRIVHTSAILSRYRLHERSKSQHDLEFLAEWTAVFMKVLECLKKKDLLTDVKKLPLYVAHYDENLPCTAHFSEQDMEQALRDHLHLHFHSYYQHRQKERCRSVARYVRKHWPEFYREKNYGRYLRRLLFLPGFVFTMKRNLTR